MKIIMLGDLHTGVSNDDPWIHGYIEKFFDFMCEYAVENGIKHMIQAGDWFDTRRAVTSTCMNFNREVLVPKLAAAGIRTWVTVGNHDAKYKNTIKHNAPREVLGHYDHIHVIDEPTTVDFDGVTWDLIPWMCDDNKEQILEFIRNSASEYCVGHWELSGYYFYKGLKSSGYSADFLKKYRRVYAGHFHTISEGGNVTYLGTPYTLTAGDENDPRGFWVFDTETHTATFVPNPVVWHRRVSYPSEIDVQSFVGVSVRVISTVEDPKLIAIEAELVKVAHQVRVVYNLAVDDSETVEFEDDENVSTEALLLEYVASVVEDPSDVEAVRRYINEALAEVK